GICLQDSPVGRRQAANAVGTLLGEGENLYGLLAQEEFARDAAIARMLEDIQKLARGVDGVRDLSGALEAYLTEDYVRCSRILASAGQAVHAAPSTSRSPSAVECNAALQQIARYDAVPVEVVLIAWCALRGAVSG